MKNNCTFEKLRKDCKQKIEMYTTLKIKRLPVQSDRLGLMTQSVIMRVYVAYGLN